MIRLFCGGTFCFDYKQNDYRKKAEDDYRAVLLKDVSLLLEKSEMVMLKEDIAYIGPFYFEADGMTDTDIVRTELEMIRRCTHAVFLLDDGLCPGTIGELMLAAGLQKTIHIFYIRKEDDEETESTLHTACWHPVILSSLINENTHLHACVSVAEANEKILHIVHGLTG